MDFINEFVVDLMYVRNYSKNTIESYRSDMEQFCEFLKKKSLDKVAVEDIRAFIKREAQISEKSLARKLSSFRTFYDFMVKKGYLTVNPMDGVEGPKIGKYLPDVLSVEEVDRLLDFEPDDNFSFRNRCIYLYF